MSAVSSNLLCLLVLLLQRQSRMREASVLRDELRRADTAERSLATHQDLLTDARQSLSSLQAQLERAELHSQDSAAQARESGTKLKDLTADKEALVTELVTANKAVSHMKQDFKCIVKCLKGSDPLSSITDFLEEAGMGSASDSGLKARSSELTWVMRRLRDHYKQSSGLYPLSVPVMLGMCLYATLLASSSACAAHTSLQCLVFHADDAFQGQLVFNSTCCLLSSACLNLESAPAFHGNCRRCYATRICYLYHCKPFTIQLEPDQVL